MKNPEKILRLAVLAQNDKNGRNARRFAALETELSALGVEFTTLKTELSSSGTGYQTLRKQNTSSA